MTRKAATVVLGCTDVEVDWGGAPVVVCSYSDLCVEWNESAATRGTWRDGDMMWNKLQLQFAAAVMLD